MTRFIHQLLSWLGLGFRDAAAMVWMTWWPLVLGFTLSGAIQSFLPRQALRKTLGTTSPSTVMRASLLGVVSSSCSYAASAMARALFARGASWTNALVFMIASTNLVIELGIVLYLLLGWQFVLAQFVGGVVMVAILAALARRFFSRRDEAQLRERVLLDSPPPSSSETTTVRSRLTDSWYYRRAAQFTVGDLTMLRKELLAGFVVAGFLNVHVPGSWWSHLFLTGHGSLGILENVVLAPLLAVISFVCSVGNIPLAATLWLHGVAFGGVISFIFADLVTLPLLLIYRRFYGTRNATRLFALLWLVMSVGGALVEILFHSVHLVPPVRRASYLEGAFPLGTTLWLNGAATLVIIGVWLLNRHNADSERSARDPICGMAVDVTAPVAIRERDGVTYYFCSPRCAERFDAGAAVASSEVGSHVDPVCFMNVDPQSTLCSVGADGHTYYFCGSGCQATFLRGDLDPVASKNELGHELDHE